MPELPRAALGLFPSPVERVGARGDAPELWLKRDDLNASDVGGNKVRALELLLAGVGPGDTVLTVGGEGSTHVLATATHAARLGARTVAVRWPHEMHPVAELVRDEAARRCAEVYRARTIAGAMARAWWIRRTRPVRWVPLGGSTPLGAIGSALAALELARQVEGGLLPAPARLVVPLGSGGTAAGLALGCAIAGLPTVVVGARVGPAIATNRHRVLRLAELARRELVRRGASGVPRMERWRVEVSGDAYAGAYGRPHRDADAAARYLEDAAGLTLDATYAAKAAAVALGLARRDDGPVLLWVTFDGRWMRAARDRLRDTIPDRP